MLRDSGALTSTQPSSCLASAALGAVELMVLFLLCVLPLLMWDPLSGTHNTMHAGMLLNVVSH